MSRDLHLAGAPMWIANEMSLGKQFKLDKLD